MFGELFADINLILKIFVMLTIISFVRNHVGTGALSIVLTLGFAYLIFFSNMWALFGGVYVFWMLLMFGISGVLIDFFFVGQGANPEEFVSTPVSHGIDLARRRGAMQKRPPMLP